MATLFLSLSKNVSCTSTLQGKHLCQISWELVKNWGSSSRRPTARPTDDTLIPIYPPYTLRVCGGIIMIHFNALDFSEYRSEEVIDFFWRLVYELIHVMSHHSEKVFFLPVISVSSSSNWKSSSSWVPSVGSRSSGGGDDARCIRRRKDSLKS